MTLSQFSQLNEFQQTYMLKKRGVLLTDRMEKGTKVFLYQVDSFYIELFHDMDHILNNSLRILKTFEDTEQLDCYLSRIDISLTFIRFFSS